MTTITEVAPQSTLAFPRPNILSSYWQATARQRLNAVLHTAPEITFDDHSRIVFFSDCHRGDGGPTDPFVPNKHLFNNVLDHYLYSGFKYIEVGDGDELWKNRYLKDIINAHPQTFKRLHQLDAQNRLYLIQGNHDIAGARSGLTNKDGIPIYKGLVLKHKMTGQNIFVTHGHQADIKSDIFHVISRFVVRHIWRRWQLLGFCRDRHHVGDGSVQHTIAQRIIQWVREEKQAIICGHTHQPALTGGENLPYFNTGSCIVRGMLTGLEIQGGDIMLVKWTCPGNSITLQRERIAPIHRLKAFQP